MCFNEASLLTTLHFLLLVQKKTKQKKKTRKSNCSAAFSEAIRCYPGTIELHGAQFLFTLMPLDYQLKGYAPECNY